MAGAKMNNKEKVWAESITHRFDNADALEKERAFQSIFQSRSDAQILAALRLCGVTRTMRLANEISLELKNYYGKEDSNDKTSTR